MAVANGTLGSTIHQKTLLPVTMDISYKITLIQVTLWGSVHLFLEAPVAMFFLSGCTAALVLTLRPVELTWWRTLQVFATWLQKSSYTPHCSSLSLFVLPPPNDGCSDRMHRQSHVTAARGAAIPFCTGSESWTQGQNHNTSIAVTNPPFTWY